MKFLLLSLLIAVALLAATVNAAGVSDEWFNRPGPWDESNLNSLLGANEAWANRLKREAPDFFSESGKEHAPKILWVGCSDARVPVNAIIGEPPGSVFVHRNVANLVVNTDVNFMSVLQYGVDVLKVKHIIVCGHYDCGGVKAAMTNVDHVAPLSLWLRNIRDVYRLHKDELNSISDITARQRRLVELNTIEQCLNIYKTAAVQRRRIATHADVGKEGVQVSFAEPRVHAFTYDPRTGLVRKLNVNFKERVDALKGVYDMYQVPNKAPSYAPSSAPTAAPSLAPAVEEIEVEAIEEGEPEVMVVEDVAAALGLDMAETVTAAPAAAPAVEQVAASLPADVVEVATQPVAVEEPVAVKHVGKSTTLRNIFQKTQF